MSSCFCTWASSSSWSATCSVGEVGPWLLLLRDGDPDGVGVVVCGEGDVVGVVVCGVGDVVVVVVVFSPLCPFTTSTRTRMPSIGTPE